MNKDSAELKSYIASENNLRDLFSQLNRSQINEMMSINIKLLIKFGLLDKAKTPNTKLMNDAVNLLIQFFGCKEE